MKKILCNYYVTYRCNSSCDFCDFKDHRKYKNTPHARLEDFIDNLPVIKKSGVRIIDFTGGEPLLNTALPEMLRIAKQNKMMTTVTSNGLLYPKYGDSIKGLVDLLHFSLDSFDPDIHNKIRGVDCYNSVMRSIEKALSIGERPDILFTVTDENFHEIEAVHKFCDKLGLILILNPVFQYFRDENLPVEAFETMNRFSKKPGVYLSKGFIKLRKEGGNQVNNPVCKAISSTIVISPMNELLLPCYHKHEKTIPIENNLAEILKSVEYSEFRKLEGRLPGCRGCTINCYFEPSFAISLNRFMLAGIPGKIKYIKRKYLKGNSLKSTVFR